MREAPRLIRRLGSGAGRAYALRGAVEGDVLFLGHEALAVGVHALPGVVGVLARIGGQASDPFGPIELAVLVLVRLVERCSTFRRRLLGKRRSGEDARCE